MFESKAWLQNLGWFINQAKKWNAWRGSDCEIGVDSLIRPKIISKYLKGPKMKNQGQYVS